MLRILFYVNEPISYITLLDGAYASNSQPDPDFHQAVGPTAHHYPGL